MRVLPGRWSSSDRTILRWACAADVCAISCCRRRSIRTSWSPSSTGDRPFSRTRRPYRWGYDCRTYWKTRWKKAINDGAKNWRNFLRNSFFLLKRCSREFRAGINDIVTGILLYDWDARVFTYNNCRYECVQYCVRTRSKNWNQFSSLCAQITFKNKPFIVDF